MSKSDNLRYSIIPARAITDPAVTAQALRVLALLGRHIDDYGWCRRSQVKMAKELACSRGTIQNSLDLLIGPVNGEGYVERREEDRVGVTHKEGRHPHCAYSYRVRLDLDDEKRIAKAGANGLAPHNVPADQHRVPPQDQHPVPTSLAPLTEPSPCEGALCEPKAGARDADGVAAQKPKSKSPYTAGFERVWTECRKWPGFAPGMSKDDAFKAYTQAADVRPPDGDLVAAAREHGRWLASENASRAKRRENPHPTIHPATWLRQHRWKGYLEQMALEVAANEMPRRITLSPEHVEALRNAGLSEAIVASWFADGEVRGNPPVFIAPSPLKQQWIERHYMRELTRAFGANVTVTVKQEPKGKAA